jgi:hypothetical protein
MPILDYFIQNYSSTDSFWGAQLDRFSSRFGSRSEFIDNPTRLTSRYPDCLPPVARPVNASVFSDVDLHWPCQPGARLRTVADAELAAVMLHSDFRIRDFLDAGPRSSEFRAKVPRPRRRETY